MLFPWEQLLTDKDGAQAVKTATSRRIVFFMP
jgi:hypothetical protein